MKILLMPLVLWTVISMTEGNFELGTYGTHIATMKKYYHTTGRGLPNTHEWICRAAGWTTLSLDTAGEFEYFLALLRHISMNDFVGVGGEQDGWQWYWLSSRKRIDYEMQWTDRNHAITDRNCLHMNQNGFASFHCDSRGNQTTTFCQKIGV